MAATKKGPGGRGGKLVSHTYKRGARKGKTVQGYITKRGNFVEATKGGQRVTLGSPGKRSKAFLTDKNVQKGNKRSGRTFTRATTSSGQSIHRYRIGGKTVDVVVKPKKTSRTEQLKLKKGKARKTKRK